MLHTYSTSSASPSSSMTPSKTPFPLVDFNGEGKGVGVGEVETKLPFDGGFAEGVEFRFLFRGVGCYRVCGLLCARRG